MKKILKLWAMDRQASAAMVGQLIIQLVYAIINASVLSVIGTIFDDLDIISWNVTLLVTLCVVNTALGVVRVMARHYAMTHVYTKLNNHFSDMVLDAEYDLYSRYSCSYVTTMREYMINITTVGSDLAAFITNGINIVVNIVAVAMVGGWIAAPIAVIYGIGTIYMKSVMHKMTENDKSTSAMYKARNQSLDDAINGFAEVKVFDRKEYYSNRIHNENDKIFRFSAERRVLKGKLNATFNIFDTLGMLAAILYALYCIESGTMSPAVGVTLIMYVWRLIDPIVSVLDLSEEFSSTLTRGKEFVKFLEDVEKHGDPDGNLRMTSFDSSIEFQHVSFAYEATNLVLDDISFVVKKGMRIGIVGASGNGKTTIFKLLNRFYRPGSGRILIDGINIDDITNSSLRTHMSAVLQDTMILPGTIMENVRYGSKATEQDVIEACQKANLLKEINSFPDKFDTYVGPRGLKLSGGQKQRIALARAFLANTDVILLDEATSALDNNSETVVQDALASLGKDKTTITIAHRLSTIKDSDLILVIDNHKIAEAGTHDELIAKKGIYFAMQK